MSQALLDAIREEAKPALWAQGVKLAREKAVALERRQGAEYVFRVKPAGRPVPFTVYLTPDDAWECSCDGAFDPCEHCVAAAITLAQGGDAVPTAAQTWTRLVYRFARAEGGLALTRELLHADGRREVLTTGLKSMVARGASELQVESGDLVVDALLAQQQRRTIPSATLQRVLGALDKAPNVLVDGRQVAVAARPLLPTALVEDGPDGAFVVTVRADARITEVLAPGVALCGEVLCCLGETALTGERLELLPSVRRYAADEVGELAGRVLPELARRFHLDVRSRRLPRVDETLRPRVQLELSQLDGGLSVFPTVVYGSPACARVDGSKLTHLGGPMPLRDVGAEARVTTELREVLDLVPGRRAVFSGPELPRFVTKLQRFRGGLTGDARRVLGTGLSLRPRFEATSGVDAFGAPRADFSLDFEVSGGRAGATVSGEAVLRAWREGLGLVPIESGGWAPLPQAWLDAHGARVQALFDAKQARGLSNHALPALAQLCGDLDVAPPSGLDALRPLAEGFDGLAPAPVPDGLEATLRPYQRRGVDWLHFLKRTGLGGVLADDMGLGKTLQAICALEPGSLVVCPTSLLANWRAELSRFRPSLSVGVYHGPGRSLGEADVTLTTYALLRLDVEVLAAKPWRAVVLDEAQAIKNPDSQVARAAFRLDAGLRVALSGTPLENRLEELWSLMRFANPGLLGGRGDFQRAWAEPIEAGDAGRLKALRAKLAPFLLRRLKRDVAPELPPRTEVVRLVSLEESERAVYDAVYAATRTQVVEALEGGGGVLKALEALLRLRQAACHPALVPGQRATTSSKVESLVEALTTAAADGHRSLVFSQWTTLLDLIEPALTAAGVGFLRLDGSTKDRGGVVERFQADDGPPVLLMSLKAGGTGLTLTAADHVFLVDPWWNPQVEAQAADRVHRIGQDKPVFVYRLVARDTVEERILALQAQKRALFEAALEGGAAAAALTKDDLLALFA